MRDIPDTGGGRNLRPVAAVAALALLLAGAFLITTYGGGLTDATDSETADVTIAATATPVENATAEYPTYRKERFEFATLVPRTVKRAAANDSTTTIRRSVDNGEVVRLERNETERTYYVRWNGGTDRPDRYFRVTVERIEN